MLPVYVYASLVPLICNVLFKKIKKLSLAGNTCVDPPDNVVNDVSIPSNVTVSTFTWKYGVDAVVFTIPFKFPVFVPTFTVIVVVVTAVIATAVLYAGSLVRGYVFCDVLLSLAHVNVIELAAIVTVSLVVSE